MSSKKLILSFWLGKISIFSKFGKSPKIFYITLICAFMNTDFMTTEVYCPITCSKFTIVKNECPDWINQFGAWVKDAVQRANSGKTINIAFDCEGFNLGTIPKSHGCIQLSEIFNDSFNIKTSGNPLRVDQKGGFIVFTPFNNETKEDLILIFNNQNIFL